NLGIADCVLGDVRQAKVLLERALAIQKTHFGSEHVEVAKTKSNMAALLYQTDQNKAALSLINECEVTFSTQFGGEQHLHRCRKLRQAIQATMQSQNFSTQEKPSLFKNDVEIGKALRTAAANGLHDELTRLLVANPSMVNAVDSKKGWTALHWAMLRKRASCVQILLDAGASYALQDSTEQRQTAIDMGISVNDTASNEVLIRHIQNKYVKAEDKNLEKVLRNAVNQGDLEAVKLFIHIGTNINSTSPSTGQTALHFASNKKHAVIIRCLLEHGASTDIQDTQGKYAIDYVGDDETLLDIFRVQNSKKAL
ncbi:MAG TPA: ankyrin repeat domain-containing protein, partial [Legionellaceae bacterium]|nr:ankyrin repeat domain-containing protein [Legionellaceae bacterium]